MPTLLVPTFVLPALRDDEFSPCDELIISLNNIQNNCNYFQYDDFESYRNCWFLELK